MAGSAGRLYAHISTWRLREDFGEGSHGAQPGVASTEKRWFQFLRMVAPSRVPTLRYYGMISCWALPSGADTMRFINLYPSAEGMREATAEANSNGELIDFITRNVEMVSELSGPVTDVFHFGPSTALRALERLEPPRSKQIGPGYANFAVWRLRRESAASQERAGSGRDEPTPDERFNDMLSELVPIITPHLRRNGLISWWVANTGNDTVAFLCASVTEEQGIASWAHVEASPQLQAFITRHLEPMERQFGPVIDVFKLGEEGSHQVTIETAMS